MTAAQTCGSWAGVRSRRCMQVNSSQESPSTSYNNGTGSSVHAPASQQQHNTALRQRANSNGWPAQTTAQQDAAPSTSANGAAPASATTNAVEGWVNNNLNSFVHESTSAGPSVASADGASSNSGLAFMPNSSPSDEKQLQARQRRRQQQQSKLSQGRQASADGAAAQQQNTQQQQQGQQQGQKQGQCGTSGGAWATVDEDMERARQLISPWRCEAGC